MMGMCRIQIYPIVLSNLSVGCLMQYFLSLSLRTFVDGIIRNSHLLKALQESDDFPKPFYFTLMSSASLELNVLFILKVRLGSNHFRINRNVSWSSGDEKCGFLIPTIGWFVAFMDVGTVSTLQVWLSLINENAFL